MTKRTAKVMLFLLSKNLFCFFFKKYFVDKMLNDTMLDFLHFMPWFEACFVPICRCTYLYMQHVRCDVFGKVYL